MDDEELGITKRVAMRDKEKEEAAMQAHHAHIPLRVCRYRWNGDVCESRIFDSIHHVPKGEGWLNTRVKPAPAPQIEPVEAISVLPALSGPPEFPAASEPRRGRKPKA